MDRHEREAELRAAHPEAAHNLYESVVGIISGAADIDDLWTAAHKLVLAARQCTEPDQTHSERIKALTAEAIADWPVEVKGESFGNVDPCKLQRDDGGHDNDELRIFREAAERSISDALHKAIRQAAYERRHEIDKLKRKVCVLLRALPGPSDVQSVTIELNKIDAEPTATLE